MKQKTARSTDEQLLLSELQLLLSEKRTYLSILRTGLAAFTAPLAVVAVIAGTSEYHGLFQNVWLTLVIVGGLVFLSAIGLSIFYQAERKIKRLNQIVQKIEKESKRLDEIVI